MSSLQAWAAPPVVTWVVGGDDEEVSALHRFIAADPRLRSQREAGLLLLWGRVDNDALPELYSRATVTVVPSLREEFGIVAIEAQACGCPVVASRVGGLPDVVADGRTGRLVAPGDAEALARALLEYVTRPGLAGECGRLAREWISERFSWSRVAKSYERLYRDPSVDSGEDGET